MRYRINRGYTDDSFDVIVEDGGIASIYHNGSNFVSVYFVARLSDCDRFVRDIYGELSFFNQQYYKDWTEESTENEMIEDALRWLVFPSPEEGWQQDDTIWSDFL
jgi:hypothetical protein